MSLDFNKWSSRIVLGLGIVIVVAVAVWFGFKVLTVEGDYSLDEKIARAFGWGVVETDENELVIPDAGNEENESENTEATVPSFASITNAPTNNCTVKYGTLMLINNGFTVEPEFIVARESELISMSQSYGVLDIDQWGGDNLIDAEAGEHLNEMLVAYGADNPGHQMRTASCFQVEETNCGGLCPSDGASDYQTGLSCNLVDSYYGTSLDTNLSEQHLDWKWLHDNAHKYGFIDRFPSNWSGGPMSDSIGPNEDGATGIFKAWHYRYVGVDAATEIATGKYNNGEYDSLEHYLKARELVDSLTTGTCK